ncbi:MAG: 50S ribosomal protein L6 [bacterium]
MSRIGKIIREIPNGVTVAVQDGLIIVKGPKGELKQAIHPDVSIIVEQEGATVKIADESDKQQKSLWGTYSSILGNMIKGVSEGFKKQLEINGVGYKAAMKGNDLILEVGYSHPVEVKANDRIQYSVEKNQITIEGIDKQLVGEVAANIRKIRKPEPYKGKGIKYIDEQIRRKAGKTASKGE